MSPLTPGSLHKDRVMFDKATRDQLLPLFQRGRGSGIPAAHHAQAIEMLKDHSAAPYLVSTASALPYFQARLPLATSY